MKRKISLKLIEDLAEQIKGRNVRVSLGQLEEATLHPQIVEIIHAFGKRDIYVHLTTNGTVLPEERSRRLIEAGLRSISFSLDAYTPETYEKIRGFDFHKVAENLKTVLRLRKEMGVPLQTRACIIRQPEAEKEIDDFVRFWKNEGIDIVSVYELSEHDDQTEESEEFSNVLFDANHGDRYPCGQLWNQCFVYPDGEVSTCCRTMILVPQLGIVSMGNLAEKPLAEIWKGKSYSQVRKSLMLRDWEKIRFCKGCQIWANYSSTSTRVSDDTTLVYNPVESYYCFDRPASKN